MTPCADSRLKRWEGVAGEAAATGDNTNTDTDTGTDIDDNGNNDKNNRQTYIKIKPVIKRL